MLLFLAMLPWCDWCLRSLHLRGFPQVPMMDEFLKVLAVDGICPFGTPNLCVPHGLLEPSGWQWRMKLQLCWQSSVLSTLHLDAVMFKKRSGCSISLWFPHLSVLLSFWIWGDRVWQRRRGAEPPSPTAEGLCLAAEHQFPLCSTVPPAQLEPSHLCCLFVPGWDLCPMHTSSDHAKTKQQWGESAVFHTSNFDGVVLCCVEIS